jgi:hypothetical protein
MRTLTTAATLLLIAFGAATAHAQSWTSHQYGPTTYYNGQAPDGSSWNGTSNTYGGTTYGRFQGPDGQTSCTSNTYAGQTYTNCN